MSLLTGAPQERGKTLLLSTGEGRSSLWKYAQRVLCFTKALPQGNFHWSLASLGIIRASQSQEGDGTPLQYSCLENPMDGGAWWAAVHGVAEGWTQLSNFTFTFHFHALEKEMATHSSVLAWRIPGTGEPGGLPSMGSHRVGHD